MHIVLLKIFISETKIETKLYILFLNLAYTQQRAFVQRVYMKVKGQYMKSLLFSKARYVHYANMPMHYDAIFRAVKMVIFR